MTKNGQNYDLLGLPFAFYRQPVPILFDPPGGPRNGNTTVNGNTTGNGSSVTDRTRPLASRASAAWP